MVIEFSLSMFELARLRILPVCYLGKSFQRAGIRETLCQRYGSFGIE